MLITSQWSELLISRLQLYIACTLSWNQVVYLAPSVDITRLWYGQQGHSLSSRVHSCVGGQYDSNVQPNYCRDRSSHLTTRFTFDDYPVTPCRSSLIDLHSSTLIRITLLRYYIIIPEISWRWWRDNEHWPTSPPILLIKMNLAFGVSIFCSIIPDINLIQCLFLPHFISVLA